MDRETLILLTNQLYRDPELLHICQDAAAELTPPKRWSEWLEESGVLLHLAECCVSWSRPPIGHGPPSSEGLLNWLLEIGGCSWNCSRVSEYREMCEAFGVPPILIQVGHQHGRGTLHNPHSVTYSAPSPSLAAAAIREAMRWEGVDMVREMTWDADPGVYTAARRERFLSTIAALESVVREHAPAATAYRLRLGAGEWTERTL